MPSANEIIHQPVRLKVLAALNAARGAPLEFNRLKQITEATNGNLGAHLATLEASGYVRMEKDFVGKRPRTRVFITPAGRRGFEAHVAYLREIMEAAEIAGAEADGFPT